ncbi:replication termination factor 2 [Amaranthus tricolor]|uniref:replication termination factor 2 n=1 Tax=Amaranthus tricolor TaxID=29722 RepID=UPI0025885586|nr:replication termination factor 2 [Amaranthus tricolor]
MDQLQVFIRYPNLQIPNRALTLNSNQTWADLKKSLLSSFNSSSSKSAFVFLSLNGKILEDSSFIASSEIRPFSTINLHFKLRGGGGDGGATGAESRDCYLNMYAEKKPDKVDPNEKRISKWTTCALSFEPLKPPCVIDRLGNLFNKEAIVKALLAKSLPKPFSLYIKGLKDLIPIRLDSSDSGFQCPISGFEFNGKYKFFALIKCGHVLSAKAIKEVKSSACLVCHQEFEESDKIPINGTDEEVEILRERMIQLKEQQKATAGKVKKSKSKQPNDALDSGSDHKLIGKKHVIDGGSITKPKLNPNLPNAAPNSKGPPVKRFKAVDIAPPNANKEIYASIFTSSKKSDFKETYSCRSLPLGRN